jgi:hypothetical protein
LTQDFDRQAHGVRRFIPPRNPIGWLTQGFTRRFEQRSGDCKQLSAIRQNAWAKRVFALDGRDFADAHTNKGGILSNTASKTSKRIERTIALIGNAYAKKLTRCSSNTALSDLPNESRLRRQRVHDVAIVLGAMHTDGLDVDPEALPIARRYVDDELSIGELTAAVSAHTTKRRTIRCFRRRSSRADIVRHRVAAADEVCAQETAHRTQRRRAVPLLSTENGLEGSVAWGLPCSS